MINKIMKYKFLKKSNLIAFLAGGICVLAFAPFNFFIASLISVSIFFTLLNFKKNKKKLFWLGFCYGFGYFLFGIYWIAISLFVDIKKFFWLVPLAITVIPAFLAIYFGLLAISYRYFSLKLKLIYNYQKIILFAIFWLFFEFLRSNLFSGFSWNMLGYAWLFEIHSSQLASIFGIYGLSFFAVIVSLLPVLAMRQKNIAKNKSFLKVVLFFLVINFIYGVFYINEKNIVKLDNAKIRLVQPNISQDIRWVEDKKIQNLLKHIQLSNIGNIDDFKAIIWTENSIPFIVDNNNDQLMQLLKNAVPNKGTLITGGIRVDYKNNQKDKISNVWNSIFFINKNGIEKHYDKHHLVPFGEYVPLHKLFRFLLIDDIVDKITGGGFGFSEGYGPKTIEVNNFSFSPLICYEAIFTNNVIEKNTKPEFFINLTNDAWFGNSIGPYQHFDMTRMRAIEYGIPLIRVANTGITAFIDHYGRIVSKIDLNQEGVVDVDLIKSNGSSFYFKYGNIATIIMMLIAVIFIIKFPKIKFFKNNKNFDH